MAIQRASLHRLSDLLAFSISFSLRRVQALDEEMDDVKHMNQMMLYSKIVTIRDAQIQEKRSAAGESGHLSVGTVGIPRNWGRYRTSKNRCRQTSVSVLKGKP